MSEALDLNLQRIWQVIRAAKSTRDFQESSRQRIVPTYSPSALGSNPVESDVTEEMSPHSSMSKAAAAVPYAVSPEHSPSTEGQPRSMENHDDAIAEPRSLSKLWRRVLKALGLTHR